ncbi:MAG: hypothetical protein KBC95_04180 [Candidatus Peribacteraceae bacterium]|nr:hypothetical protein [Candidatus Peribacteraceae bacterium]
MRNVFLTALIIGFVAGSIGAMFVFRHEKTPTSPPAFAWSYEASSREDIPQTTISLTARYEDSTSNTKVVDTIEGDCNDVESPADAYAKSTMILCYYAGLGRYYKVIDASGSYLVQRKIFEEASPEYDPPELPFETIERF